MDDFFDIDNEQCMSIQQSTEFPQKLDDFMIEDFGITEEAIHSVLS